MFNQKKYKKSKIVWAYSLFYTLVLRSQFKAFGCWVKCRLKTPIKPCFIHTKIIFLLLHETVRVHLECDGRNIVTDVGGTKNWSATWDKNSTLKRPSLSELLPQHKNVEYSTIYRTENHQKVQRIWTHLWARDLAKNRNFKEERDHPAASLATCTFIDV